MSQDMEAMIRKILEDMQKGTPSPVSAVAQTSTTFGRRRLGSN